MRRNMLRRVEYGSMSSRIHNRDPEINYAIKQNRRNKGILKRAQIDLLYNYDKKQVDSNLSLNSTS